MTRSAIRPRNIPLTAFVVTFIPFALLLVAALLLPEMGDDVTHTRVKHTIWLSTVLLIPGLCLYVLVQGDERRKIYAQLFVTFSYLAYMVHFYLATFVVFGGIAGIFANMRTWIAVTNLGVTVAWTADTFLAWWGPRHSSAVVKARTIFYVFLFLVFVVTDLFLRPGVIRYLGILLFVSVVICLCIRRRTGLRLLPIPQATPPNIGETPGIARARLCFAFSTLGILMLAAHVAAQIMAAVDLNTAAQHPGAESHSVLFYRTIFSIWAVLVLLTFALCSYVLTRPGTRNSYWRGFWTVAFLALVVHLYWTIVATFHWDYPRILHSHSGEANNTEQYVDHPIADIVLAVWWGLDVALVWLWPRSPKYVRLQRGAIHLLAFIMFFGAFVLASKATVAANFLGVSMAILVTSAFVIRVIRFESDPNTFLLMLYIRTFQTINFLLPWYKLATPLAVANLGALRDVLRAKNLHDTSSIPVTRIDGLRKAPDFDRGFLDEREEDGYFNDLTKPAMGSSSLNPTDDTLSSEFTLSTPGARFGRNIPLQEVGPLPTEPLLEPNPRLISNLLLARRTGAFKPATTLNLLAAAWIQFQTHDWFNHGAPVRGRELEVPVPPGDPWPDSIMRIRRTRPDPTRHDPTQPYPDAGPGDGYVATYANAETHWWDGSEVYGSSLSAASNLRTPADDGKIRVANDGYDTPPKRSQLEQTGLTVNWWLGLSLLHDLFAREHNAICDALRRRYPGWNGNQIYRTARLVNTALMAKIHTVDWTPAILGHPALQVGMRANWWGLLTEHVKKSLGRVSESESFSGIAGSRTNHHGADYCLTEEFTSVYRMHSLMPDEFKLRSAANGSTLAKLKLGSEKDSDPEDVVGPFAREHALKHGTMSDIMYSFGVANPGALVLRNFPNWMRRLRRFRQAAYDETIDLATIDIVRDRERGVPRYNRFRRLFHLPEFASIDELIAQSEQLSSDRELAESFKKIYKNDVEQVDLLVGMHAETQPEGFGFSDTAFRVFILMASRRIKSDRFLSSDYRPEVYTQVGYDWVENNNMTTVLQRHYPELNSAFQNNANPFAPWNQPDC